MALDTRLEVRLRATQTGGADLVGATAPLDLVKTVLLTTGTGANQSDRMWSDHRVVTASATDSLDVSGALTDAFGVTVTFAKIKLILVIAATTNTNNVLVTRPATNGVPWLSAAGDQIIVRPGGIELWACTDATAVAVTAGTGDLIDIINSAGGTSVEYDIVIIGTSA